MNGTFRFTPRLESLDDRLTPGGASGGVLRSGVGDAGVATVAVVAHRPAEDQPPVLSGGARGGIIEADGVTSGGDLGRGGASGSYELLLKRNSGETLPSVHSVGIVDMALGRYAGEEIPQHPGG